MRENLGTPDINNISIEIVKKEKPNEAVIVERRGINPTTGAQNQQQDIKEEDILMELKKFSVKVNLNG